MFLTIPVLISRTFNEFEASEANVALGKKRTPEEVEVELEKLLAPHDASTQLRISCRSAGNCVKYVHVPNYGSHFDFWEPDDSSWRIFEHREEDVEVEQRIYAGEERLGHEVIAASSLPLNVSYDAIVTPDARYHEFRFPMPRQEASARIKTLLRRHSECLAIVCKAHI